MTANQKSGAGKTAIAAFAAEILQTVKEADNGGA
jgi:hypothetical protein